MHKLPEIYAQKSTSKVETPRSENLENKRFENLGSIILATYVFFGAFVLLFTHSLWSQFVSELGLTTFWDLLTIDDALLFLPFALVGFFSVLLITNDAAKHKMLHRVVTKKVGEAKSKEVVPLIAGLLNGILVSLTYSTYLAIIPGLTSAFSVSLTVVNAGIVGVATFYYTLPPATELLAESEEAESSRAMLEALKLEHNTLMSLSSSTIWVSIILIVSVVFITWTQVIYPSFDPTLRDTPNFFNLTTISVCQLAYLTVGVYFGILSRLWDRAWCISKEIAKLKIE